VWRERGWRFFKKRRLKLSLEKVCGYLLGRVLATVEISGET
jgi:hypothetical protein